jgi:hypothetical protein
MNDSNLRKFVIGVALGVSGFGIAAVSIPNTFTAGTPIKSADVNANFSVLKTALETASGVNDGAISRAKLSISGTAADGKVLKAQGSDLVWGDDAVGAGGSTYTAGAGLALTGTAFSVKFPLSGTISASDAGVIALNVTSSDPAKTAIKGLGGNFGVVGDTFSPTGVGVLAANSGAADGVALEISGGIKVSGGTKPAFIHVATAANISTNITCIDNVLTNNKPNAILIITQNFGSSGVYNNASVGVNYLGAAGAFPNRWCIFNQIGGITVTIPVNATFNVLVFNQ